jgi:hypothetical protein
MDIFMKNQDCPGDPLFDPSFFWYQGSETTPPCEEGNYLFNLRCSSYDFDESLKNEY